MQRRPAPFTTQFFRNLGMSDTITAIVEAQEKYGEVTDVRSPFPPLYIPLGFVLSFVSTYKLMT